MYCRMCGSDIGTETVCPVCGAGENESEKEAKRKAAVAEYVRANRKDRDRIETENLRPSIDTFADKNFEGSFDKYMKKRLVTGKTFVKVLKVVWGVSLGIFFLLIILAESGRVSSTAYLDFFPLFFFFSPAVSVLISIAVSVQKNKKFFKSIEENHQKNVIEDDFRYPICLDNKDKVRFGKKYVYSKNSAKLLDYKDIIRVYQHVVRERTVYIIIPIGPAVEITRELRCKDSSGKIHTLCSLEIRGKSDAFVEAVNVFLQERYPHIKLGWSDGGWDDLSSSDS